MAEKINMFEAVKKLFRSELIKPGVMYTEIQIANLLVQIYPAIGFELGVLLPDFQSGRLKTLRGALNDLVWRDAEGVWALRRGTQHGWGLIRATDTRPRLFYLGAEEYPDTDLPLEDGFDDSGAVFLTHKGRKRPAKYVRDRVRREWAFKVAVHRAQLVGTCAGCGHNIPTPGHGQLDHEVSLYLGDKAGEDVDVPENIYLLCAACNLKKSGHRSYAEMQAALMKMDPPMTTEYHVERARRARAARQRATITL